MSSVQKVGSFQEVLDIIEARQFKQPPSYRERYAPTDGQINALIAKLREADNRANMPLRVLQEKYDGQDWFVASFGTASREPFEGKPGLEADIFVTTDHVHASEMRGDALDDAECYVLMRNHLPLIIAALEELFAMRRSGERDQ